MLSLLSLQTETIEITITLINPHPNYNIITFLSKYGKCSYVDECKTRASRMLRFGRKIKHKSFQKAILKKPRSNDCHDQN